MLAASADIGFEVADWPVDFPMVVGNLLDHQVDLSCFTTLYLDSFQRYQEIPSRSTKKIQVKLAAQKTSCPFRF